MGFFVLRRPFTGSISESALPNPRITSLNRVAGTLGIKNDVHVVGSYQVIAGFSTIFTLPFGTRSVQVDADFVASGDLLAAGLHWGYARASLFVNVKAMGLNVFNMPNGDNHELRRLIVEQYASFYNYTPSVGLFRGWYWRIAMASFTPAATTRRYMLSGTIESWVGAGGYGSWATASITDGSSLDGFFITTVP